ncbi:MAG: hypothetical protein WKF75_05930, partial [Singulisphaera sp.]
VIVLAWLVGVQRPASPPVQKPYSQGLPGVQRPAAELRPKQEREGLARAMDLKALEKPLSSTELGDLLSLDLPDSSPLRHLIDRKLVGLVSRL